MDQQPTKSTLEIEIDKFVRFIATLALSMAFIFFLIGCVVTHFKNVLQIFISGFLVVIVANIPQGLPATVTSQVCTIVQFGKNICLSIANDNRPSNGKE
jgi:sodium/potassium-transporting ATPase subunit alpha